MTSWFRFASGLDKDPRTLAVKHDLSIETPQLIGHLYLIWSWALDHAPNGNIAEYEEWLIEEVAGWQGEEEALYEALVEHHFFLVDDEEDDVIRLADWNAKQ